MVLAVRDTDAHVMVMGWAHPEVQDRRRQFMKTPNNFFHSYLAKLLNQIYLHRMLKYISLHKTGMNMEYF